jgi:hypothetical protein
MAEQSTDELTDTAIISMVQRQRTANQNVMLQMRVRRMLINRDTAALESNLTGTTLPPPFHQTSLAIRTMIGEPAKAAQHYATRLSANRPDISVVPITAGNDITATVEKDAGKQERMDNQFWVEAGGRDAQWTCGWGMAVTEAAYYLTLPRDAQFGLPDRIYYEDKTDDDISHLKAAGMTTPVKVQSPSGKLVYAEHGDVWAARRKDAAKNRAISGRSLFTLRAYPRDMVLRQRDEDGIKWAAIVEEVPGSMVGPGSDLAMAAAKQTNALPDGNAVPPDDLGLYGLMRGPKGEIIGGIARGGPLGSTWNASGVFTIVRFFSRTEQVILVGGQGSLQGAKVVYRGAHGCTVQGVPSCPVVEVPFMRTDIDVPGKEFSTALSQVFGIIPQINQLLTLESNAAIFNGLPRWVVEQKDGATIRGQDGEPKIIEQAATPGLDPSQAAAYPGTLRQLTIDTKSLHEMLVLYFERLEAAMPSEVLEGAAGSSAPAYQVRQLIQQAQEILRQPVDNHCAGVQQIVQMWHGWLRDLDTPVYFFAAPGNRKNKRSLRGIIEFDPKDLTDSIVVTQELDTPAEATVRLQEGLELLKAGVLTFEDFFDQYAKSQDARQSVIDMYVSQVTAHVIGGVPAPAGSLIAMIADGVRGAVNFALLEQSPNYAIASAENAVQQMQQQPQQVTSPMPGGGSITAGATGALSGPMQPGMGGNVANAAGIRQPGMGMAPTIEQQLGNGIPGGRSVPTPAGGM